MLLLLQFFFNGNLADFNLTAFLNVIANFLAIQTDDIVVVSEAKRDFSVSFYITAPGADDLDTAIVNAVNSDNAVFTNAGFMPTSVSTQIYAIIVPSTSGVMNSGSATTSPFTAGGITAGGITAGEITTGKLKTSSNVVQDQSSSGLTTGDKIAIGIVIPAGVILAVILITAAVCYRRKSRNYDEEKAVEMKVQKSKPQRKDTRESEVSKTGSASSSESSGSSSSEESSQASSKKSKSESESSDESSSDAESKSSKSSRSRSSSRSSKSSK